LFIRTGPARAPAGGRVREEAEKLAVSWVKLAVSWVKLAVSEVKLAVSQVKLRVS